jgi:nucleotide-binding universal stress UspA family protein
MIKNILVPTDFSDLARNALNLAYGIAEKTGARIQLLNVIEPPHGSSFSAMGEIDTSANDFEAVFIRQLKEKMEDKMQDLVSEETFKDVELNGRVDVGRPYETIADEITENDTNLVVMSTNGASGVEEVLIGSNAEKVVRRSKCPVISVHDPVTIDDINDIVFATNLRDNQEKTLKELKTIQDIFGARLHVVTINTPSNFSSDRYYKKKMEEFAQNNQIKDYTFTVYNDDTEEDGIIYFADEIDADMIALATHGRTGIRHVLSGSIAEDVVNHTKRPVWTFHLS